MGKLVTLPIKKFSVSEMEDERFLRVHIQAIKEGQNLNESDFLLSGMETCKDTFKMMPLLCAFPKMMHGEYEIGDAHNSEVKYDVDTSDIYYSYLDPTSERCVGLVPHDSEISIQNIHGENWIVLDAIIWKEYNYELVKDILKKKRIGGKTRISVEIEVVDSYEENGIQKLLTWRGLGITLLNDKTQEAVIGANLKAYVESDKYERYKIAMSAQYSHENNDPVEAVKEEVKTEETLNNNRYGLALDKEVNKTVVLSKVNTIYKKLDLDKEEKAVKEKLSQNGYSCFSVGEKVALLMKNGKVFSLKLAEDADATEFAEDAITPMSVYVDVETEAESEAVKLAVDEEYANEFSDATKRMEEAEVRMSEVETKFADSVKKLEESEAEKSEMSKKIAELSEEIKKMNEAVDAEKKEKMAEEFNEAVDGDDDIDGEFKAKMCDDIKFGKFATMEDVKKEIAYVKYMKNEKVRLSAKKGLTYKVEEVKPVVSNNTFDELQKLVREN